MCLCVHVTIRKCVRHVMGGHEAGGTREGRGSALDSGQMTTDVTFHPSLWLLRSLPWETEELSFGTMWAYSPGKQKKKKKKKRLQRQTG